MVTRYVNGTCQAASGAPALQCPVCLGTAAVWFAGGVAHSKVDGRQGVTGMRVELQNNAMRLGSINCQEIIFILLGNLATVGDGNGSQGPYIVQRAFLSMGWGNALSLTGSEGARETGSQGDREPGSQGDRASTA